jgi:2-polyprenyl-3-methyl-5-hydroxy-6-metoxy-1,4-benzoquinol methylase
LRHEGFAEVVGVEPSRTAIAAAPVHRQAWIRHGMFEEKDFALDSFDLICCFMTLEHVRDPQVVTRAASKLLRPGGVFIAVTHNYCSMINRALGSRSPIIDIEHLQLFSNKNLLTLFKIAGFHNIEVKAFLNTYRASYWLRLIPIPNVFKSWMSKFLVTTRLGNVKLTLNVGNLVTHGFMQN